MAKAKQVCKHRQDKYLKEIPDKIKVGGYVFKIIKDYHFKEDTKLDGQVDEDLLEIRLSDVDRGGNKKHKDCLKRIFIHEVLHAIDIVYNADGLEEDKIDRLSFGLYQVLKDNNLFQ